MASSIAGVSHGVFIGSDRFTTREFGTGHYIGPEVEEKIDGFSFGLILHKVLIGRPFFGSQNRSQSASSESKFLNDLSLSISYQIITIAWPDAKIHRKVRDGRRIEPAGKVAEGNAREVCRRPQAVSDFCLHKESVRPAV
jgi:hypothetical protein